MQIGVGRVIFYIINYIILLYLINLNSCAYRPLRKWLRLGLVIIGINIALVITGMSESLVYALNIFITAYLYMQFLSLQIYKSVYCNLFITVVLLFNIILSKLVIIMMLTGIDEGLKLEYTTYLTRTGFTMITAIYIRYNSIDIYESCNFTNTIFLVCLNFLCLLTLICYEDHKYLLFEEHAFFISVLLVIIYIGIMTRIKIKSDMIIEYNRILHSKELYNNAENLFEEIKLSQHEVSNQLQTMKILAESNKISIDKDSYLDNISKNIKMQRIIKLDSRLLMGLLYRKLVEAEETDIKFEIIVNKIDKIKKLTEYEVIEIVACLISNAFEASLRNNQKNREVMFKLYSRNGKDIIEVWNNFNRIEVNEIDCFFEKGFSTKKDETGSGYGLTNLKKILKKREAEIFVENKEVHKCNFLVFTVVVD